MHPPALELAELHAKPNLATKRRMALCPRLTCFAGIAIIRQMKPYHLENQTHDPIHGYIPFTSSAQLSGDECSEREVIDSPWVQRMRHIHQLQTAWWVFPTAEHTRFQHIVGAMHMGSRFAASLYASLRENCPDCPSRGYVESLLRMAGLLHDVGHGPFGHFFDAHFLQRHGETHETLGAKIIRQYLAPYLHKLRRTPDNSLAPEECLDVEHVAWLIVRPGGPTDTEEKPRWLQFLRGVLSGIYTIDNLDFVLRDAYMSGFSRQAFDLDRLLHYSFFSERGLTIHDRGIDALMRFMTSRADLFRSIYFHRTVRAIDLTLVDLFSDSRDLLFPGNPAERLDEYLEFTESALLVDVRRWRQSKDPRIQKLGHRWVDLLDRKIPWTMVCQRHLVYSESDAERSSIFSDPKLAEHAIRGQAMGALDGVSLRVDIARHIFRPHTTGPSLGQNFLYDSSRESIRPLTANQLFRRMPVSFRICRVYAIDPQHSATIAASIDQLLGVSAIDDATNM
jgi:HD superfamily phosphohydrolase